MRSTNCFINVNEIANEYPDIRLKKITGITFDKSKESILSYREQLKEKGYIYFSGYFPEKQVLGAADVIDRYLLENNYIEKAEDGYKLVSKKGILLSGYRELTHDKSFLALVQSKEIQQLMDCLLGEESITLDTKWVRVLAPKEATDTHADYFRFQKLGLPLYTCWIPLTNQGMKEGTIALCEDTFTMDFEGEMLSQEELPAKFLDLVPNSCWAYADFKIGDILIFDIRTIHASFRNDSTFLRKNCDTRWMPKSKSKLLSLL